MLGVPVLYIKWYKIDYVMRFMYLLEACVFLLKFLSYHHVWHDLRYHLIQANKIKELKLKKTKSEPIKIEDVN